MGLDFDLATVAGMAGLGGSAVATVGTAVFFKGLIMRILSQVIVTAGLSFVGFIALLNVLGFEIVKPGAVAPTPAGSDMFSPSSAPPAGAPSGGAYIKSPWSK